uniref:EF-hand domain-containing protein n=1 Tax=Hanusia phi TaxID=3032 RepID=A0A7S0HCV0_9CRYP
MESAIEVGSNFPEERGEEFLHTSRTFTKDAESWRGEEHSEQRSQKQEGDNFEESEEELRDFVEMCIEAFNEVDVDATELIGTEQLGVVLGELVDQEVIPPYNDEDLTILACDMDVEGNGFIPRREFLDVVLRWAKGYKMTADKHGKLSFTFLGPPPVDFTATELEEAFNLFDVKRTGAIEASHIRSVMKAVDDMDVTSLEARKMIEAAAGDALKESISLEQFKSILSWQPSDGHDAVFDDLGTGRS